MTEIRNNVVWVIRDWNLDIIWDLMLACLPVGREIGASAASPTICLIFHINPLVRDYA